MDKSEEEKAVGDVIDRLATRFPHIPREHVAEIVNELHTALDGNPIRDYVPVLVEREAKGQLRKETDPEDTQTPA